MFADGKRSYTYDPEGSGRLLSATQGGVLSSYQYDPFGPRISKTVGGVSTLYLLDEQGREWAEYDRSGNLLARCYYSPLFVAPVASADAGGNLTFAQMDQLGSVVAISSGSGQLMARYSYLPYGDTPSMSLSGTAFGYAGYRYDAETGTYHTSSRNYDPRLGRFLQPDPIRQQGGINIYAYAGGDPINGTDPSGLASPQNDDNSDNGGTGGGGTVGGIGDTNNSDYGGGGCGCGAGGGGSANPTPPISVNGNDQGVANFINNNPVVGRKFFSAYSAVSVLTDKYGNFAGTVIQAAYSANQQQHILGVEQEIQEYISNGYSIISPSPVAVLVPGFDTPRFYDFLASDPASIKNLGVEVKRRLVTQSG